MRKMPSLYTPPPLWVGLKIGEFFEEEDHIRVGFEIGDCQCSAWTAQCPAKRSSVHSDWTAQCPAKRKGPVQEAIHHRSYNFAIVWVGFEIGDVIG